uniref:FCS-type domain-containing protein n=1 Tax=Takifugu rubripes TaxID=31033 RepID=A0A674MX75_TAKRU
CVTWEMDGEKQEDSNSRIAAITFPSTSAAVTVATVCPCSASGARAPSSSLSIISSDRQAVQVIQHAIQRPHNMAAQFLQQMYAAQQQHLMLQTAALQQQHQHSPHLQSLATMHQVRSPGCLSYESFRHELQAPAASVAAVQSELPPVTSCSSNKHMRSQTPRNSPASSSSLTSASSQTPIPAAKVLPQPPPLLAAPQRWSSFPQVQSRPPPPLILPRFPQNSPVTLQRLSQDVRTQVAQKEQEPPATERLVQTLYQNVPPPQTVAIDLKVQPAAHNAKPLVSCFPDIFCASPCSTVVDLSLSLSSHAQIRPPAAEEPSQIAASSSNHPPPSPPQLPHILPAAVRCPSHPPSSPRSPFEPITTHVLTHLVEGFVIQEGLEPFPVSFFRGLSVALHLPINPLAANQSISSDSEMESNGPAVDGEVVWVWSREVAEHGESVGGVLRCEYCGSRGYACAFLSSKRFCSMTCDSWFRLLHNQQTGRWGHRATGRRERPPSRVNGVSREHFLKRVS